MTSVLAKLFLIVLICFCTTKKILKQDNCSSDCRAMANSVAGDFKICGADSRDCCVAVGASEYGDCDNESSTEMCREGTFAFKC
jgi:hypothetical protein